MKKRLQGFLAGLLVCSLIMGMPVFAAGVTKSIKAVFNAVVVKIDGKVIGGDKIVYNNKVYIEADKVATMLGKSFNWNKANNMIDIYNKPITDTKKSVVNKGKIITFPDKSIDFKIRSIIKKPTGDIFEGDVENISTFGIYDNDKDLKVLSIEGLQYLKNLKILNISNGSNIIDISPIASLINLETINLSNNRIENLSPLSNLKKVKSLNLSSNSISDVSPLKKLVSLQTLVINNNPIYDISSLNQLKNLKSDFQYFQTRFDICFLKDNKYLLIRLQGAPWGQVVVDNNNKIYTSELSLLIQILNLSNGEFEILQSENPYIDGIIEYTSISHDYSIKEKVTYTGVSSSYVERTLTNKDGSKSLFFSDKPNEPKGTIETKYGRLYCLDDIFKYFGLKYSIQYDINRKLCGVKIE